MGEEVSGEGHGGVEGGEGGLVAMVKVGVRGDEEGARVAIELTS